MTGPIDAEGCIAVMGMHRGGTSATAGLLIGLGLSGPRPEDLVPADGTNARGHWESQAVVLCNSHILLARGGTGYAPPAVAVGWEGDATLREARAEAVQWLVSTANGRPLVLKDPRLCSTLPLWRSVVPVGLGAVLVLREPMAVAESLQARDGLPITLSLAMWDRYLRSAATTLEGLPTLVVEYDAMLRDPVGAAMTLAEFVGGLGIESTGRAEYAATTLDPALRHEHRGTPGYDSQLADLRDLFETLAGRAGVHASWTVPPLNQEPAWVEDVLRMRRDYASVVRELYWMKESRVYRFASRVWSLRGEAPSPILENAPSCDEIDL